MDSSGFLDVWTFGLGRDARSLVAFCPPGLGRGGGCAFGPPVVFRTCETGRMDFRTETHNTFRQFYELVMSELGSYEIRLEGWLRSSRAGGRMGSGVRVGWHVGGRGPGVRIRFAGSSCANPESEGRALLTWDCSCGTALPLRGHVHTAPKSKSSDVQPRKPETQGSPKVQPRPWPQSERPNATAGRALRPSPKVQTSS